MGSYGGIVGASAPTMVCFRRMSGEGQKDIVAVARKLALRLRRLLLSKEPYVVGLVE